MIQRLAKTLATVSLVKAAEFRDELAVTFVAFLVQVDAVQLQAMRGEGQKYHTEVTEAQGDATRLGWYNWVLLWVLLLCLSKR